jgi:hypothetical protein
MFLVELLIIVILISVVATAYWNFRSGQLEPLPQDLEATSQNSFIQAALDEIGYHICFARGNAARTPVKPLLIEDSDRGDRIVVFHNNARYEYYVDENNQLIRRCGGENIVMVSGVYSLNVSKIGAQTLVVTISTSFMDEQGLGPGNLVSRSFSTVVAANGIS